MGARAGRLPWSLPLPALRHGPWPRSRSQQACDGTAVHALLGCALQSQALVLRFVCSTVETRHSKLHAHRETHL